LEYTVEQRRILSHPAKLHNTDTKRKS
jgi:hypothetical protein